MWGLCARDNCNILQLLRLDGSPTWPNEAAALVFTPGPGRSTIRLAEPRPGRDRPGWVRQASGRK